ncbi:MAG TPA: undecaprenyl-diphosphatase UppP [Blastocatellia bacterium]|nr:undecaprenyl-diphosphatase UppP [Blastocatellia bacterium]
MTIIHAIIFGLIQGLTEFIPISSTAHLTIAGHLLGEIKNDQDWTAFIAVIQLGTLLAVIIYFWGDIINIIRGFVIANLGIIKKRPITQSDKQNAWLGWLVIIGTLPVAVLGLALKRIIEGPFTKDLRVIAFGVIFVALLLVVAEMVGRQKRDLKTIKAGDAIAVGVAQVFALIPGFSRSGSTICGGLFAGLTRESAARFSFLLSIPAIAASGLLELPKALHSVSTDWTSLAVATLISAISGYLSIAFLLNYLKRHTTYLFVGYRIALGLLLIALLWTGRLAAHG